LSEVVAVGKSGRYICIDLVPRKVVDARSKRRSGRVFSAVLGVDRRDASPPCAALQQVLK
jgi:hypothetical protein